MPSPIWLTTPELILLRTDLGGSPVEIALPYRGLTPHRWRVAAIRGAEAKSARRRPPLEGSVGAGGFELVKLALSSHGAVDIVFALEDITGQTVEQRLLHIV